MMTRTMEGSAPAGPAAAWRAVQQRDPAADGSLVYGVCSTGIYCRPSCPAKRPTRSRVEFFATSELAEQAGYRACRRCRPADTGPSPARQSADRMVEAALRQIENRLEERLTLREIARGAGASPHHLHRIFSRSLGMTPKEYLDARRLHRLRSRLRGAASVTDALYEAGYGSSSRLYERSNARLGMTPATFRRGGLGMRIRFTTVTSPLGRVLVALSGRGVCAVTLGEDDSKLEEGLAAEFPLAEIRRSRPGLKRTASAVVKAIEGLAHASVPLDVRATAFQWRVWNALQRIPLGSTRSYAAVAEAIGRPGAARAVASACARNRIAVLIPCHRAVRGDGGLGGYRWGLKVKKRLLEREAAVPRHAGRRSVR